MPYNLDMAPERRLSVKILAHKIRRYLPEWIYNALLRGRYALFRRRCRNPAIPNITYSDGTWTNRKTTDDLLAIEQMLRAEPEGMAVLQIGIGNSSLFAAIGGRTSRFAGITIVKDEVDYARHRFPADFGTRYEVRLMNKYSSEIATLPGRFDYIVDNDLSSYACCHEHFEQMLDAYRTLLKPGAGILVGHTGLGYFDSGFGLTPDMMQRIAARHGLTFTTGPACHILRRVD